MTSGVLAAPLGRRLGLGLSVAVLAAILDQLAKWLILAAFRPPGIDTAPFFTGQRITVLPFLDFVLTWNRGVSFGVGNQPGAYNALLFTLLAAVIAGGLIVWMARSDDRLVLVSLGLVVGGALGNAIDRLRLGAVVDFIYVHVGAFDWWPAMNLADWAISLGAILLALDSLFTRRESHKNTP